MSAWITITCDTNSQNISNNSSNVTVKVTIGWNGQTFNKHLKAGSLTIDGTTYNFTTSFNDNMTWEGSKVLYEKVLDVAHNSNGTRSLPCSAMYTVNESAGNIQRDSKTFTLTRIPNGTISLSLILSEPESGISIANNQSTVTATVRATASGYVKNSSQVGNITIDGTTYSFTNSVDMENTYKDIGSASKVITHNPDGTKSISASAWYNTALISGVVSAQGTLTLKPIARASQPGVSPDTVAMGSSTKITTNRAASSFTHTLSYTFGSSTGTIGPDKGVGADYTWTVPNLASVIPNAAIGNGTISCTTYSGSTNVGTKTVPIKLTVPNSGVYAASISSVSYSDSTNYYNTYGAYVQNRSVLSTSMSSTGGSGANKTEYITVDGTKYNSSSVTGFTLRNTGSMTLSYQVISSRPVSASDATKRSATTTRTITVVPYSTPLISTFGVSRYPDDSSDKARVTYDLSITNINDKNLNARNCTLSYRPVGDSNWSEQTISFGNLYSISGELIVDNISIERSYEFRLDLDDTHSHSEAFKTISTAETILDVYRNGKGLAIGKVAEREGLDIGWPTTFESDVTGTGTATFNHVTVSGDGPSLEVRDKTSNKPVYLHAVSNGNRGVWDGAAGKWQTYMNNSNELHVGTGLNVDGGENVSGSVWSKVSSDVEQVIGVNKEGSSRIYMYRNAAGNVGLYGVKTDGKTGFGIIGANGATGAVSVPGTATNVTEKKSLSSASHSGWGTNNGYVPDMSFIAYWNGAYSSNNASNLRYCANGTMIGTNNILSYIDSYAARKSVIKAAASDGSYYFSVNTSKWGSNREMGLIIISSQNTIASGFAVATFEGSNIWLGAKLGTISATISGSQLKVTGNAASWGRCTIIGTPNVISGIS